MTNESELKDMATENSKAKMKKETGREGQAEHTVGELQDTPKAQIVTLGSQERKLHKYLNSLKLMSNA